MRLSLGGYFRGRRRLELRQRRAERIEAWGPGKSIFFDGSPNCGSDSGVFVVGEID
jgi:hypothetical protein